ncbi:MAG: hypothetical protein ACYS6K_11880 [Planctomycetota bacterium]
MAANAIGLFSILFFEWDAFSIVSLYWVSPGSSRINDVK